MVGSSLATWSRNEDGGARDQYVEPRNPDEVAALNAAPGVVHLVFIDELPFNIIQPEQCPLSARSGHATSLAFNAEARDFRSAFGGILPSTYDSRSSGTR